MKKQLIGLMAILVVAGLAFSVASPAMAFCPCKVHVTKQQTQVRKSAAVTKADSTQPRIQMNYRDYGDPAVLSATEPGYRWSTRENTPTYYNAQVFGFEPY